MRKHSSAILAAACSHPFCLLILASSHLFAFDASLRPATPEKLKMTLCIQLRFGRSRVLSNLGFPNDFIREISEQSERLTRSPDTRCCEPVKMQADLHINYISRISLSGLNGKEDIWPTQGASFLWLTLPQAEGLVFLVGGGFSASSLSSWPRPYAGFSISL